MAFVTTISVSPEFWQLAKDYNLSWTEIARIGMSLKLAELGVKEYDTNLNLFRKMTLFREKLEQVSQEFDELKAKTNS